MKNFWKLYAFILDEGGRQNLLRLLEAELGMYRLLNNRNR